MAKDKKRILLLGLDEGLLWQITRALAILEDQIDVCSALDPATAVDLCRTSYNNAPFHLIVVDGWEETWKAGYLLGWDETFSMARGKWIILVDAVPLEGILDERVASAASYLEKPFNPKELPGIVTKLLDEDDRKEPGPGDSLEEPAALVPEPAHSTSSPPPRVPLVLGESYQLPVEPIETGAGSQETRPGPETLSAQTTQAAPSGNNKDFHTCMDRGFECLKSKDRAGALAHWNKASELRPRDRRVQANLRQLERLMIKKSAKVPAPH